MIIDYEPGLVDFLAPYEEQVQQRKQMYGPDVVPDYWEHGLDVYARHCVKCGRWAKWLAGCDWADWVTWRVTECAFCGILDSRIEEAA